MNKENSSQMILALIGVALAISLIGTAISLNGMSSLGGKYSGVTGAAIYNSEGKVSVAAETSINNVVSVDFGSGHVNPSCAYCIMDTTGYIDNDCCIGFNAPKKGFVIENTGRKPVSVRYICTGQCNAKGFIGGSDPAFQYRISSNNARAGGQITGSNINALDSENSCDNENGLTGSSGWNDVSDSGNYLCGGPKNYLLDYADEKDELAFDLLVKMPRDAENSGYRSAKFTFIAESSEIVS